MTIQILNQEIRIRPSAIEGFFGCSYQWGKHFLEGVSSIPNSRAAIGTAIHAGIEQVHIDNMKAGRKDAFSLGAATDAAIEAFKEEEQKGLSFDEGETQSSCHVEILKGTDAFIDDILPFAKIPEAVEEFYKVDLNHKLVSELGGTIDYIGNGEIADVKTSKRKPTPSSYVVQQSIYKYLAEANGINVDTNLIHGINLKKSGPEGMILPLEPNVEYSKNLVNMMLDTLDVVVEDRIPVEVIMRPNPKYMFCSKKFCAFFGKCPATKPLELQPTKVVVKL